VPERATGRRGDRPGGGGAASRRHTAGPARGEGTFLICTFWLAQALAEACELDRARRKLEQAIAYANDVGLLSEEVDPETGEMLGNYPQAFSHIGLINAAWAISQAEQGITPDMRRPMTGGIPT
jgi:GH15 family glucan-1,4-alpha-glucosidase